MRRSSKRLIADLVDGRSENPTEAMEIIARSPRLRAGYDEQVAARESLARLEPVALTDGERADLHREVWTELRAPEPASQTPAPAWGWRAAGAAAAVAVVIGGGALLLQTSGDSGGEDAFAADVTTTASAGGTIAVNEDMGDGGAPVPEAAGVEDMLQSFAEAVRTQIDPARAPAEAPLRCADNKELEGMEPVATLDVDGVEYQAWVPSESIANGLDDATPITFVDVETCTVRQLER